MVENGTWTSDDGGDGTEVSSGLGMHSRQQRIMGMAPITAEAE